MKPLLALALCSSLAAAQAAPRLRENEVRVTLLGTGTPVPVKDRAGPATLVEAGGRSRASEPSSVPRAGGAR